MKDLNWKKIDSKIILEDKGIKLFLNKYKINKKEFANHYILDYPDWVSVVALTDNCEIVLVK